MADQLFGKTWNMNPGTSLFSTAFKPSEETRLYEELPNGYKLTVSGKHQGNPYSWNYTAFYDGEKHPVHGRADVNSIKIYKLDDHNTVGFFFKDDEFGGPYSRLVSEDGKQLTVQAAGRHPDGSPFFDVIKYRA